ncbi:uncharacterized protein PHACADRAFT_150026 [Phanerochaete carnosa HHB-10118-sp]|uniref:Uncharacterized protein n=1 Tax=Phanerochaete carnosa (strain HHB-10118-sp) TaxID=650164 RepID=K5UP62_PHACS|nr:uncharacterized protein PHACADRAFT_150026 [Phanerochaete carnosa HHB-10118-sp]EKM51556.1 hypothetical protein PHACADRAFT_150026 [Phanerochaete carnosa HHB-10118-sp]
MDVHLPANKGSSPLHIQGFKTDMPLFRHAIADLADSVRFNSLMLSTSNVGIHSQSLLADRAELKSSNNAIVGNFTVRDTLVIRTSNSPIAANITMINGGEDKVTDVTLITSNRQVLAKYSTISSLMRLISSPLYSNFSLISTTKSENGGSFRVNTKTINSPLNVNFTSAPVDSLLHFKGATSNSPAYVSLHSTYEGSFTLRSSSLLQPRIEQREDVEDPAGKDRRRNVEIYSIRRGIAEGKVTWVPAETEKVLGSVGLRSSNMPVVLVV